MKLEVGKSYVNRLGEVRKIIKMIMIPLRAHPFWDGDYCYKETGEYLYEPHERDLIAEAPEAVGTCQIMPATNTQPDDSGPAFPTPVAQAFGDGRLAIGGLTVREWYAGMALAGLLASPHEDYSEPDAMRKYRADESFLQADAMIKASRK